MAESKLAKMEGKTAQQRAMTALNAVRNNVPEIKAATNPILDLKSFQNFGQIIANNGGQLGVAMLNYMAPRIAFHIIEVKLWENPLAIFNKGDMPFGEIGEHSYINPAKCHIFDDPDIPDEKVLAAWESEIYTTFYRMNYQLDYIATIKTLEIQKYFLSWDGYDQLIARMTDSLYEGAKVDYFNTLLYLVSRNLLDGNIGVENVGDFLANPSAATIEMKTASNDMGFYSTKYNIAGVETFTPKQDQFFLVTSRYDAVQSVEVLAKAFNMDKVEFEGRSVIIGDFDRLDWKRLDKIFKYEPRYHRFTEEEMAKLKGKVAAVVIDKDWFQLWKNYETFETAFNGLKSHWNYFLHIGKTVAISPYANAIAYVNGGGEVTGVTVEKDAIDAYPNEIIHINPVVAGTGFYSSKVEFESNNKQVIVNNMGVVYVLYNATGTATITITSEQNPTQAATVTITIK